ncbi:MAG: sulfurtransferase TusA family protein [Gammaproteobacteria bacterium]|nr:sulfurtransferase TusA family protein [Gammaproteobacteria bacterium]
MIQFDQTLDLSGLNCPMPLLRTKAILARMDSGQVLNVIGTDPDSPREFLVYARQAGHEILELVETDGKFHCLIRKA